MRIRARIYKITPDGKVELNIINFATEGTELGIEYYADFTKVK